MDSVTIHADGAERTARADVCASAEKPLRYTQNADNPRRASGRGCSVGVVAGTGFEPVTFRL